MNDAHKIAARKLRSLATVIRAEAYAPHEFGVREAMEAEAVELERRADILAPLPKAPVEPAPVASRERVAEALNDHYYDVGWSKERQGFRCVCGWLGEDHVQHVTDALAADVFRDEAQVKAEALEPFRKYFSNGGPDTPIRTAWDHGIECWSAPASDLRDLLAGEPS